MRKYYLAYEERYKKAHNEGLMWFSDAPTPELIEWVEYYGVPHNDDICEVGCGEGRDALFLSSKGYKITAVDASESAITKCKELAEKKGLQVDWRVADALFLGDRDTKKYKWVYSIAALHMLVDDDDRSKFLSSLYNMLEPNGKLLLVSMGDGISERKTDTSAAFELQERTNYVSGTRIMVAATSYRSISWENHKREIENAGFIIERTINTENSEYDKCMTVYLSRR